jgi:hypothetical protein
MKRILLVAAILSTILSSKAGGPFDEKNEFRFGISSIPGAFIRLPGNYYISGKEARFDWQYKHAFNDETRLRVGVTHVMLKGLSGFQNSFSTNPYYNIGIEKNINEDPSALRLYYSLDVYHAALVSWYRIPNFSFNRFNRGFGISPGFGAQIKLGDYWSMGTEFSFALGMHEELVGYNSPTLVFKYFMPRVLGFNLGYHF